MIRKGYPNLNYMKSRHYYQLAFSWPRSKIHRDIIWVLPAQEKSFLIIDSHKKENIGKIVCFSEVMAYFTEIIEPEYIKQLDKKRKRLQLLNGK